MSKLHTVKQNLNKTKNKLRRVLEDIDRDNEYWREGVTINRRRLAPGYVGLEKGYIDRRLFSKRRIVTKMRAGFALASDHSASLSGGRYSSYWAEICYLLGGMHSLADSLGIKSSSGIVRFDSSGWGSSEGASTRNRPNVSIAVDHNMHWKDAYLEPLLSYQPRGGTSLISYAESAIDMALNMDDVTHRIAFFLTDGECGEKVYLESLRLQAKAKGVTLVGIGLGVQGQGLPNGIDGYSAEEISVKMVDRIVEVLRAND